MTAVEQVVAALQERGVEWIATLCGHGLDPFFQAARRAGLRLVDTRNEQAAAYLADAYARLTGRLAVCAVSSGVAHVNALTGIVNAWFDGAPVLLISGAGDLTTAGMGHFQDMPQAEIASPVTKFARVIDDAERAAQILDEAVERALELPCGPVHLTFPMDVQRTEVGHAISRGAGRSGVSSGQAEDSPGALPACERPLIVAGSDLFYAGAAEEMLAFSERHRIPVVVPIWDRGVVERAGTFAGVIGAASGGPRLLADADCIIMAGAAADYRVGYLQPGAIRADARIVHRLRGWQSLQAGDYADWLAEARRRRDEFRAAVERTGEQQAERGPHAVDIIAALARVLPQDAVLLIDGGSIGQWAHQLLCDRYPRHWLTCGPSGVVGWGLGGAMGARMAYPDRPVVLFSGDGAFTFNVAEIECAVRQKLHFVAIVADDQGWGITRTGHLRQFGEAIASSLGPIAFDRLAESLGARGVVVQKWKDIAPAIEQALGEPAVTVIHVPVVGGNPG
jgi:thiamine pyrophosphate-dependent acetolactate synthase large subunit-like protein